MPRHLTTERLALFGTLLAIFGELHPLCDHWVQGSKTAMRKRLYGTDLVHADGSPAGPHSTRPTMTTSTLGRRAVASHVASYTAVQLGATVAVTRTFGYRVTPAASPRRPSAAAEMGKQPATLLRAADHARLSEETPGTQPTGPHPNVNGIGSPLTGGWQHPTMP